MYHNASNFAILRFCGSTSKFAANLKYWNLKAPFFKSLSEQTQMPQTPERNKTNFKLLHGRMCRYMSNFQRSYNQEEPLTTTQVKCEVRANIPRLKESSQQIREKTILMYHILSTPNIEYLNNANAAITWMRRNRSQECQQLVNKTIELIEYLVESESESENTNTQYVCAMELFFSVEIRELVIDYCNALRSLLVSHLEGTTSRNSRR